MVHFTGSLKLIVSEAEDLRPTDFALRHQVVGLITKSQQQLLDPYISIDVDDTLLGRTTTKQKTLKPVWNEEFTTEVRNGQNICLTVFHDAAIPPDEFVANCNIAFEDIVDKKTSDIWIDLEPTGRLHVVIELLGATSDDCLRLMLNDCTPAFKDERFAELKGALLRSDMVIWGNP